jgi:hypothetical protein
MKTPPFPPELTMKVWHTGTVASPRLSNTAVPALVTARLEPNPQEVIFNVVRPTSDEGFSVLVDKVTVFRKSIEVVTDFDPPPTHPKGPPDKEEVEQVIATSDGVTPVEVAVDDIVEFSISASSMSDDFSETTRQLIVDSDNWDPISIELTFTRASDIKPMLETIDLTAIQGQTVTAQLPVQWVGGPGHDVVCYLDTHFETNPSEASPIELISSPIAVPRGGSGVVNMTFQIGRLCRVGMKQLTAWLIGETVYSFPVNVNVLPAPVPVVAPTEHSHGGGYVVKRHGSKLRLELNQLLVTSVDIPSEQVTDEQSNKALEDIGREVGEYLKKNFEDIANGKIKAAQIGAAFYGTATTIVLAIFLPASVTGKLLGAAVNLGIPVSPEKIGEFYGAVVDDLIAILKGEDDELSVAQVVGTLGTVFFTQVAPIAPFASAARYFGADGWSFTRRVGETIGEGLEESINAIESIVSDLGGFLGDTLGDAVDFVGGLFG